MVSLPSFFECPKSGLQPIYAKQQKEQRRWTVEELRGRQGAHASIGPFDQTVGRLFSFGVAYICKFWRLHGIKLSQMIIRDTKSHRVAQ